MDGDAIKKLRATIGSSARDLARVLGVEQKDVLSWERGETFPTKRHVDAMARLLDAPPKSPTARAPGSHPVHARLDDPEFWAIVRKLLAHPTLFTAVRDLAAAHPDPARPESR